MAHKNMPPGKRSLTLIVVARALELLAVILLNGVDDASEMRMRHNVTNSAFVKKEKAVWMCE